MSFKTTPHTDRSVYEYLLALDCPRALTVWILYTNGEHDQLATLEWNPSDYDKIITTLDGVRCSLAASKFLSKANFLATSFDRKKVALEKFFEAERQCADTNKRLIRSQENLPVTRDIMLMMARKIDLVLGDIDPEEFADSCDWGPGASTSVKRSRASKPHKYAASRDITPSAYDFVKDWMPLAYPSWDVGFFCIQPASKIVTVPKNSKTDRTIAIEPDLNIWFQKGVGTMIRRRLQRVGINLSDQRINQERARIGSKYGHLATVDFSAASDTIALVLCAEILPRDWYNLIVSLRTSCGVVGSQPVHFEKVSSMGNGFTFELESLIFWALAVCVCEHLGLETKGISVFGDDVILPTEAFDLFSSVSADLGFTVNKEKSYASTSFRESCGSFWYEGMCVKPIYLKEVLDTLEANVRFTNNVRRLSHRWLNGLGCDKRLRRLWTYLVAHCGRKTPRISEGFGDVGIITNRDDPHIVERQIAAGFDSIRVRSWVFRPVHYDEVAHWGVFLSKVRQIGIPMDGPARGNKIPRALLTLRSTSWLEIPRWHDLGDWF